MKVFDGEDAQVPDESAMAAQLHAKQVDMGDVEHMETTAGEKV